MATSSIPPNIISNNKLQKSNTTLTESPIEHLRDNYTPEYFFKMLLSRVGVRLWKLRYIGWDPIVQELHFQV